jgi:hypothetical protein
MPPAGEDVRCTRMKWSVKGEWGITVVTEGMWQEMQPLLGFTGQVVEPDAAARFRRRGRPWLEPAAGGAPPAWQDRHLAS